MSYMESEIIKKKFYEKTEEKLTREYKIISCSSHVYDFPTGVGNSNVLCTGVDNFT